MIEEEREETTVMAGGSTSEESQQPLTTATSTSNATEYPPVKKKLMIAVSQSKIGDGYSKTSEDAFNWTLDNIIGTSYDRYKVYLIHVQVPQMWIRRLFSLVRSYCADIRNRWFLGIRAPGYSRVAESPDDHRKNKLEFMEFFKRKCCDKNIECESLIKMGCPEKVICDEVKHVQPDLLVLGNRGLSDFPRLFRVNVSEYCAKYAECCVIIRIKRHPALIPFHEDIQLG